MPARTAKGREIFECDLQAIGDFLSAQAQADGFDQCVLHRRGSSQSIEGLDSNRPNAFHLDDLLGRRDHVAAAAHQFGDVVSRHEHMVLLASLARSTLRGGEAAHDAAEKLLDGQVRLALARGQRLADSIMEQVAPVAGQIVRHDVRSPPDATLIGKVEFGDFLLDLGTGERSIASFS